MPHLCSEANIISVTLNNMGNPQSFNLHQVSQDLGSNHLNKTHNYEGLPQKSKWFSPYVCVYLPTWTKALIYIQQHVLVIINYQPCNLSGASGSLRQFYNP